MPNLSSVIVFVFPLAFVPLNPNHHGFVKPLKQKRLSRYLSIKDKKALLIT
jgi:hypothetical protein